MEDGLCRFCSLVRYVALCGRCPSACARAFGRRSVPERASLPGAAPLRSSSRQLIASSPQPRPEAKSPPSNDSSRNKPSGQIADKLIFGSWQMIGGSGARISRCSQARWDGASSRAPI